MFSLFLGIFNKIAIMSHFPIYNLPFHLPLSLFSFQPCTLLSKHYLFLFELSGLCLHTTTGYFNPTLSYLLAGPCQPLESAAIFHIRWKPLTLLSLRLSKLMVLPRPFYLNSHCNLPLQSPPLTGDRAV